MARSGSRIVDLDARLHRFYTTEATAYFEWCEGEKFLYYNLIKPAFMRLLNERGHIMALDFGAGRTSLPQWLETNGVRNMVHVTGQDITAANLDYLKLHCDASFIGDVWNIKSEFDLIVSTFAYEHLVFPEKVLAHCLQVLRPGGILYIVSPCYTLPGYLPPALRHFPLWKQIGLNAFLAASSAVVRLTGRPAFWIMTEPAVFNLAFQRDYDAVHMVSKNDLHAFLREQCERIPIKLPEASGQGYLWLRHMMLIAAYRKCGSYSV